METYAEKYKLIFKIDQKQEYIRILGSEFYKRIKIRRRMIINNKVFLLKEEISTKNINENELIIIVIFFGKINNKRLMFEDYSLLEKIYQKEKVENVYHPKIYSDNIN